MVRLLRRLLRDAFVALDAKDRYWLASCVGKRLGAFNDMVDVTFPMRSQFKQVTGQDPVNIEQKYKKSYSTVLDTKFIFTTNKELNITTQTSDLRRCIYVEWPRNPNTPRKGYEDDLWDERAGILHKCKLVYERMVQEHGAIVVDQEAAKEIGEQAELRFQVMFNQKLKADETSWISRAALRRHLTDRHGTLMSNQDLQRVQGMDETYMRRDRAKDRRQRAVPEGLPRDRSGGRNTWSGHRRRAHQAQCEVTIVVSRTGPDSPASSGPQDFRATSAITREGQTEPEKSKISVSCQSKHLGAICTARAGLKSQSETIVKVIKWNHRLASNSLGRSPRTLESSEANHAQKPRRIRMGYQEHA